MTLSFNLYKEAFEAAKGYIDENPCDPDIFPKQWEAWVKYEAALKRLEEFLDNRKPPNTKGA